MEIMSFMVQFLRDSYDEIRHTRKIFRYRKIFVEIMSFMVQFLRDSYDEIRHTRKNKYELENWTFTSSPTPMILTITGYLYFVLYLGPKLMKNREPFKLKNFLILYNFLQVLLCVWLFLKPFYTERGFEYLTQPCNSNFGEPFEREVERTGWWAMFSKMLDLCDTVFFVLRKKQSQVSFLHVYHHVIMAVSAWLYIKYLPGQQVIIPGWINAFVHIVMYSYYLLAALGPRFQKYLWWKKYLTILQLGQFVIMILFLGTIAMLKNCNVPKVLTVYAIMNVILFLILFSNFYKESYSSKKTVHTKAN